MPQPWVNLRGVMWWLPILKDFGPNIQHIVEVYKIIADTLSRFPSAYTNKYDPSTMKYRCHTNELFAISREEKKRTFYPPKSLNCAKRTAKVAEKKYSNSEDTFWIGDLVLQASSQQIQDDLQWYRNIHTLNSLQTCAISVPFIS